MAREPYDTDLTDEQWAVLEPLLPPAKPGGRPRETDLREVLNALLYLNRSGCAWRLVPHDFGIPWKTVYNYFRAWIADATWDCIVAELRLEVRLAEGRQPTPSAGSIDSQSVKTAGAGGERGYDGAKKVTGRKRHIVVDTLGLLLAVVVTGADLDDAKGAEQVLSCVDSEVFERLEVLWADHKYHNYGLYDWLEDNAAYRLDIVSRPEGAKGFVLLPRRWVVERTLAWLNRARRLSKDYERRTDVSEAMVKITMLNLMLHRLCPDNTQPAFSYRSDEKKQVA